MVNENAQLYTIEGLASAVLMMTTAYLVLSTTTILTPGETHITDLQLEQLGYDALAVMDIPREYDSPSQLSQFIQENKKDDFRQFLLKYLNSTASRIDTINFSASVWYVANDGSCKEHTFSAEDTYRQNTVKVTRWVIIRDAINSPDVDMAAGRSHVVLLEVLLWRD